MSLGIMMAAVAASVVGCADDPMEHDMEAGATPPVLAAVPAEALAPAEYRPMARQVQLGRSGAAYIKTDIQQVVSTEPPLQIKPPKASAIVGATVPPSPIITATALPPPPVTQEKFQVFFDFAAATITAAAEQILQQAAASAKAAHVTTISVTGHTDTVGADKFNLALSVERAKAVQAALVKLGIPANEITIAGEGKSDLLVPTADGVREAQNRRVLILMH